MKKLLTVLCLLIVGISAKPQFTKHVITAASGYYLHNKFAFLQHQPSDISKKQPLIIFLHGAGQVNALNTFADTTTSSGVSSLAVNHAGDLPYFFSGSAGDSNNLSIKRFHINGTPSGDSVMFWLLAPQCNNISPSGNNYWLRYYVAELLKYAKNSAITPYVDTNRIYLCGLSMGGGGTLIAVANPEINPQLAAAYASCPGYNMPLSGTDSDPTDYQMLAHSGLPLWIAHSQDDNVTDPLTTSPLDGTRYSQRCIDSLNKYKQIFPYKFFKFTTGTHYIWNRAFDIATYGKGWPGVNGYNYVYSSGGIFQWFLEFTTATRRVPAGYP